MPPASSARRRRQMEHRGPPAAEGRGGGTRARQYSPTPASAPDWLHTVYENHILAPLDT
jgi:hypothetical protein